MDIVYVLGTGSKWGNNEIRYSIRSLMKHCTNFGRIFIVGEKPEFLKFDDWLVHTPATDRMKKEVNIWLKVLKACNDPRISDNFLFINDDHFLLKNIDPASYPYYAKGDLADKQYSGSDSYQMVLKSTLHTLQKSNLPTWHFDVHTPIVFNKKMFIQAFDHFADILNSNQELVMKSSYANFWKIKPTLFKDIKLMRGCSLVELHAYYQSRHVISVGDEGLTRNFRQWLNFHFPEPSIWEKGSH